MLSLIQMHQKNSILKEYYKTEVKVVVAPDHKNSLPDNMHVQRKQYGINNHLNGTIHGDMGNTLNRTETKIYKNDT